jgi:hypothetical protein
MQREIGGFRDCQKLERVELSRSVEVVGKWAGKGGCHIFIAGKGPEKEEEEKREITLSGIVSHLMGKCGGNIHDKGVVEITASSSSNRARNTANLEDDSCFCSENTPGQWICLDFKTLRIEPTHYTIRAGYGFYLKNWAVEGSDDGASWTGIDRRENNSDLSKAWDMKTFTVSRSGSFERIRLCQTGPNHWSINQLVLSAFEVFGAVTGLQ